MQLTGTFPYVKSSVKAVIRALSSSRFPTPIPSGQKRDAESAVDARKSDRDLFAEESRLRNRNEGSSSELAEGELDPEALPIFSNAIGATGEGFATLGEQGTIRSSIGKLRSVFGPARFQELVFGTRDTFTFGRTNPFFISGSSDTSC